MRYLLVVIFFLSYFSSDVAAQEKHFIFIQSDNNQPFYFSLNGKLYSSSASGYLIVPRLDNGTYNFSIGFAKNAYPEQSFNYVVENKDLGFSLKNFGDKGFGLFNLQTLDVTMGETGGADNISKALSEKDAEKNNIDPVISFNRTKKAPATLKTRTKVNADSAQEKPIAKNYKENTEQEPKLDGVLNDDATNDNNIQNNNGASTDITKVSESKMEDGVHLSYMDGEGKAGDTVNVIIPSDQTAANMVEDNTSATEEVADETNSAATEAPSSEANTATADSLKFLDINTNNSKKDNVNDPVSRSDNSIPAIGNSKCKNIASDDDYTRLRRKMAGETTDEKMINAAKKMYKNKCFTTNQIRRLSTLFLSDEGRYNFFNASYNSVSDVGEYSTLQSEFIDPAFTDRFKAMLK